MKKILGIFSLVIIAVLFVATCRSAEDNDKSDAIILQGTWKGHEIGGDTNGTCYLIFTGKNAEYRGSDTNDWDKGTFTIHEDTKPRQLLFTITACAAPEYVGKTSQVIYEIKDGTLTLTGNEPGNTNVPSSFDAPDARKFVLKKE